jgi:hypothetical protein
MSQTQDAWSLYTAFAFFTVAVIGGHKCSGYKIAATEKLAGYIICQYLISFKFLMTEVIKNTN